MQHNKSISHSATLKNEIGIQGSSEKVDCKPERGANCIWSCQL